MFYDVRRDGAPSGVGPVPYPLPPRLVCTLYVVRRRVKVSLSYAPSSKLPLTERLIEK